MNLWRCDYCGHQQEQHSRKCADCGGPRGSVDMSGEVVTWSALESEWYKDTLAGKMQELNDGISNVKIIIGGEFIPVLSKCIESISGLSRYSPL